RESGAGAYSVLGSGLSDDAAAPAQPCRRPAGFAERTSRTGESMGYCGLMPAALITLAHFAVSSAMSFPKSAGEPASTIPPMSASRSMILALARPALVSLLRASTIAAGRVFLAAVTHHQLRPSPRRKY